MSVDWNSVIIVWNKGGMRVWGIVFSLGRVEFKIAFVQTDLITIVSHLKIYFWKSIETDVTVKEQINCINKIDLNFKY